MPAKPPDPRRHRGVALVVCLVLLTSLTLLAVATLRTATLELTMAGNAHYMVQAFELAQTGLVVAVARINDGELGLVAADGWTHVAAVTGDDGNIGHAYEATLRYLYRDKPPPAAFSAEAGDTEAHYFEITATGTTHARGAKSVQTRGFWVPAVDSRPIRLTYWFAHAGP